MNLRLDHLLDDLRANGDAILRAIDADPLLIKRQSGSLVLANAGALLFTPQSPHQLYAKGIVYRREPFELVSLPLVKIYNLGERSVSAADVAGIAAEGGNARLHFLRKLDGTLLQRFQYEGRVYFTTRGMIEGGPCYGSYDEDAPARAANFDFLGTARRIAREKYPALVEPRPEFENLTLVFEFLHPETRVITNYGEREDLVLLSCFDRADYRYRTFAEVKALAAAHALAHVDEFTPKGDTLGEQIESLLASIAGSDQEGTVITIEHGHRVVYRVKLKSPDYLRVLKLVVTCTYGRVVEMADAHPEWKGWADMEAHLRSLGREQVPEEVLGFYREHFDTFSTYLADCERLRAWAAECAAHIRAEAEAEAGAGNDRLLRKCFAARAVKLPHKALLFAAFDSRLDIAAVREVVKSPEGAKEAVAIVAVEPPGGAGRVLRHTATRPAHAGGSTKHGANLRATSPLTSCERVLGVWWKHATVRRSRTRFDSWRGYISSAEAAVAKQVFYRQCRLSKRIENGELQLVSWIPEPFAAAGRIVKLRDDDGAWDDGWVVVGAGTRRLPVDQVPDFHQLSKAHLRATGDAETAPKN